ncbi:MAG: hypothetical protein ACRD2W_10570 [Acidimicrobiales bacterium]
MSGSRWEVRSQVIMAVTAVIGLVITLLTVGPLRVFGGDGGGGGVQQNASALPDTRVAGGATTTPACYATYFAGIAGERVRVLEEGAFEVAFLTQGAPLDQPAGLHFTSGGRHLGAMRFQYSPASDAFRMESVVDAACAPIGQYENVTRPALGKGTLGYNDDLRVVFGADAYRFHFREGTGYLKLTFARAG